MRFLVIIALLQALTLQVAGTPGPCDDGVNYFLNAASCANNVSDVLCENVFKGGKGPVVNGGPVGQEDPLCHTMTGDLPMQCAKQCGLCCKRPEFDCENPKVSELNCSIVTQDDCKKYPKYLTTWCPNVCGFCKENGCVDDVVGCSTQVPKMCFDVVMHDWAAEHCRKSCDRCASPYPVDTPTVVPTLAPTVGQTTKKSVVVTTTHKVAVPPVAAKCFDKNKECPTFQNYCNNPYYLDDSDPANHPKIQCAKTCGYCR